MLVSTVLVVCVFHNPKNHQEGIFFQYDLVNCWRIVRSYFEMNIPSWYRWWDLRPVTWPCMLWPDISKYEPPYYSPALYNPISLKRHNTIDRHFIRASAQVCRTILIRRNLPSKVLSVVRRHIKLEGREERGSRQIKSAQNFDIMRWAWANLGSPQGRDVFLDRHIGHISPVKLPGWDRNCPGYYK